MFHLTRLLQQFKKIKIVVFEIHEKALFLVAHLSVQDRIYLMWELYISQSIMTKEALWIVAWHCNLRNKNHHY